MVSEFNLLIKNVTIIDGTGKPSFKGSIGVSGENISAIGDVKGDAAEVIDATGLIATPGFIDAHSHADGTILWYPRCESFVMQGITTFVGGNCGTSPGPIGDFVRVPSLLADHLDQFDPYKYYPKKLYPLEQVNKWMDEKFGFKIDWRTMDGFFKRIEKVGISTNYVPFVGHGNIRYMIMGMDYKRPATQGEVNQMIEPIRQAMQEGCIGMSTGMDYAPDVFASQDEIIQHVHLLENYDGIYAPHWRRTGRRRDMKMGVRANDRIKGIQECIEVCRKTRVPLHFAHLQYGYRISPESPIKLDKVNAEVTLDIIDEAIAEGLDISFDYITPPHNGLRTLPYLVSLLAPWIRETGSPERLAEFLKIEDYRKDVKECLFSGKWFIRTKYNPNLNPNWAKNIIVLKHKDGKYNNKSIAEIAALRERDELDTFFDLISDDPYTRGGVNYWVSTEHAKVFLKHPRASVCLDSSSYDVEYEQERPPYSLPKNGTFDGFVSVLVKYVKELKHICIEEAIMNMSTNIANSFKINGRGILKPGSYADIVILDMNNLKIMSDSLEPRRHPKGIEYVIVNGIKVVEKGNHTGARPGKLLKRE